MFAFAGLFHVIRISISLYYGSTGSYVILEVAYMLFILLLIDLNLILLQKVCYLAWSSIETSNRL